MLPALGWRGGAPLLCAGAEPSCSCSAAAAAHLAISSLPEEGSRGLLQPAPLAPNGACCLAALAARGLLLLLPAACVGERARLLER